MFFGFRWRMRTALAVAVVMLWALLEPGAAGARAAEAFPDKLALLAMLRDGAFEALDARLSAYQEGYEAGRTPEKLATFAFSAFENSDPALEPYLNQWVARMPRSYAALLARGINYSHLGWLSRGARWARNTKREQFATMQRYFAKAVPDLYGALERNRKLSLAYGYLMAIGTATSSKETVTGIFQKALEANADSPLLRDRYMFGLQPKWGGTREKMEAYFRQAYRDLPEDQVTKELVLFALKITARRLSKDRSRREAIALYDQAVALREESLLFYRRGSNYHFLEQYDSALADYNRALELWPQDPDVLSSRGWTHRKQNRPEAALADWNRALELDLLNPEFLRYRAQALRNQGRYEEALLDLDNAMIYGAHDRRVWSIRGNLYLNHLKDYAAAATDFQRATELDPDRAGDWYSYGVALFYLIDCAMVDALRMYRRLCEDGRKCSPKKLEWAQGSLEHLATSGECPQ